MYTRWRTRGTVTNEDGAFEDSPRLSQDVRQNMLSNISKCIEKEKLPQSWELNFFIATGHNSATFVWKDNLSDGKLIVLMDYRSNVTNRHRYSAVNYRIRVSFTIEVQASWCTLNLAFGTHEHRKEMSGFCSMLHTLQESYNADVRTKNNRSRTSDYL